LLFIFKAIPIIFPSGNPNSNISVPFICVFICLSILIVQRLNATAQLFCVVFLFLAIPIAIGSRRAKIFLF
jgi:hypothetical protein